MNEFYLSASDAAVNPREPDILTNVRLEAYTMFKLQVRFILGHKFTKTVLLLQGDSVGSQLRY